jgi:hypothetical protein
VADHRRYNGRQWPPSRPPRGVDARPRDDHDGGRLGHPPLRRCGGGRGGGERFSRQKHHSGVPFHAIEYRLDGAGIRLAEVSLYWKPWILRHKAMQAARALLISRDMFTARVDRGVAQVSQSYLGMLRYPSLLRQRFGPSEFKFHYVEHHVSHGARWTTCTSAPASPRPGALTRSPGPACDARCSPTTTSSRGWPG